jgi:hypothetical protein
MLTGLLALWACVGASSPAAPQGGISRRHHPWGCFEVGAWARVRVVSETFDAERTITSVFQTKTSLVKSEDDGVTLQIETAVEVGGREVRREPQTVKQGWQGELANENVKITQLAPGEVTLQGRRIPCKIEQLERVTPTGKTTTRIFYSDSFPPYLLRRETTRTDPEGKTQIGQTTVEVVEVDVPCRLLARIWNTYHVKRVSTHARGRSTTLSVISPRVPGGVIRQDSEEYDSEGRLTSRSSLELVDFGLEPEQEWTGLLRRRRSPRFRQRYRVAPYWYQVPGDEPR